MGFTVSFADSLKDEPSLPPGIYHAEVKKAEETRSKNSGDGMFILTLVSLDHGKKQLTKDYVMVEGKARGMGTRKLLALGLPMKDESFFLDASQITGRRAYVNVVEEEFTNDKGITRKTLKVQGVKDDGSSFGYWPDDAPPAAYTEKDEDDVGDPLSADDTPF